MGNELLSLIESNGFGEILSEEFFQRPSIQVAADLLGTIIVSNKENRLTVARITETEAYPGYDAASHVYQKKEPTQRTLAQYQKGGKLYMYLIMGLHIMTSVVTGEIDQPDVVFIRSVEPISGIDIMRQRRGYNKENLRGLASGPGRLSKALGLELKDNGKEIFVGDSDVMILKGTSGNIDIEQGLRINLGVHGADEIAAQEAMNRQWRYYIKDSEFLST